MAICTIQIFYYLISDTYSEDILLYVPLKKYIYIYNFLHFLYGRPLLIVRSLVQIYPEK
jgi:hypothetical protein